MSKKENYEIRPNSKPNVSRHQHGGSAFVYDKPANFGRSIKKLLNYISQFKMFYIIAILIACIGTILEVIAPRFVQEVVHLIESGIGDKIDLQEITKFAIIIASLYLISFLSGFLQRYLTSTATRKTTKSLRTLIEAKINNLPLSYFDKTTHGDVLSRITNDVDTIGQTLNQSMNQLFTGILTIIGLIVMMFITNYILAIITIALNFIGIGLIAVIIKKGQKFFVGQQQYLGEINGHIEEVYSGHNVIKLFSAEKNVQEKFDELNNKLRGAGWRAMFMGGSMRPLMSFVANFTFVIVCIIGAVLATTQVIYFSVVIAFMIYVRMFAQPLSNLAQSVSQLQSTAAASERVFVFLEEKEMLKDESNIVLSAINGDIEFENVKFGYDKGKTIIKDFSADIKGGQKVAIVGPTGSGKTTLVNLLMRFYELGDGDIKIDKVPISNLSRHNIHELFGMVLQDTWVFEGTIRENIVYGKENVTDEDLDRVCKLTGLYHFVQTLDNGYDTVIGSRLILSQGQKQLITIARAMVKDSPMLILDEATSSVDTRTELLIQRAMDKLLSNRTAFIIAHRLSTIRNADLILVLKDGNIIESGTHDELLSDPNGFYYNLYNSQFADADIN